MRRLPGVEHRSSARATKRLGRSTTQHLSRYDRVMGSYRSVLGIRERFVAQNSCKPTPKSVQIGKDRNLIDSGNRQVCFDLMSLRARNYNLSKILPESFRKVRKSVFVGTVNSKAGSLRTDPSRKVRRIDCDGKFLAEGHRSRISIRQPRFVSIGMSRNHSDFRPGCNDLILLCRKLVQSPWF